MTKTLHRIALSTLLACLTLTACAGYDNGVTADDVQADDDPVAAPGDDNGIGTSPSDPLVTCEASAGAGVQCKLSAAGARAVHVQPCGLWWSPSTATLAVARRDAAPTDPDMAQLALPGGLSCSALIASAPAVAASQGGATVVYYVSAPGFTEKPIKPGTRWCAWPPSCTNPDAACCTSECVQIGDETICSND